jgi:hypothetical protein
MNTAETDNVLIAEIPNASMFTIENDASASLDVSADVDVSVRNTTKGLVRRRTCYRRMIR